MNLTRPKNLNLFTIHQPIPAIVSILHRISGFFLFLLVPFLIWGLQASLTESGFATLQEWHDKVFIRFLIWLILIPLIFHLIAGIRHLLLDLQVGSSLRGGRLSATLTIIIALLLIILAGISLW